MDILGSLQQGLAVALQPTNLLVMLAGCFLGTLIGALPGLGPVNGVAILLPVAYAMKLPAESSLILCASVYFGCEYGGRISAILLNVPGDAGAVMTTLDGYPMAQRGEAGPAMSISAWSSFVGGTVAMAGLTLFAPFLASYALSFGPAEYVALMVFAGACLFSMVGRNPAKTLVAFALGLLFASVGVDGTTGVYRFTFGAVELHGGIPFLIVVVGLFSVSEILILLEQTKRGQSMLRLTGRTLFNARELATTWWGTLRASVVGFFIGVLPGAGASVASAITYMMEKRLTDREGTFGKGDIRGIAAPEAANNSAAGGALVPMLTLGVPGSGTTAIMLGALALYNITPGPQLFTEQPKLVWGLVVALWIANIVLLVLNIPFVGLFSRLLQTRASILMPFIAVISLMGVYVVHQTAFDLLLLIGLGVLAYAMRKLDFPLAPVILGFVLGDLLELNLRRALAITDGDWSILWKSGIALALWVAAALIAVAPLLFRRRRPA
jgi:putative tricarboxylic transport membrane protein